MHWSEKKAVWSQSFSSATLRSSELPKQGQLETLKKEMKTNSVGSQQEKDAEFSKGR